MADTYKENFAEVLDLVCGQRRIAENAWPEEQQEFAKHVMEAMAKVYSHGHSNGVEFVVSGGTRKPNPYLKGKKK